MLQVVNNFTVFESVYGRFVVNRHCDFQADVLAKTGRAPHQARALAPYALVALESVGGPDARTLGTLIERAAA